MTQVRFRQRLSDIPLRKPGSLRRSAPRTVVSSGAPSPVPPLDAVASIVATVPDKSIAYRTTKRILDVTLSSAGLIVLSPVFAALAVAIKLDSKGPVFYRQTRVGLNGSEFGCFKFRSMKPNADQLQEALAHLNERNGPVFKIKNDPRMTRLGRFLRKSSVDELPQLINVLRGEMSLVGPRPPIPKEVSNYQPHHHLRLSVIPGITGLQQITARDEPDFETWVRLDAQYIERRSLALDLWILLKTPYVVAFGRNAS